jgi:hypothetical protein
MSCLLVRGGTMPRSLSIRIAATLNLVPGLLKCAGVQECANVLVCESVLMC